MSFFPEFLYKLGPRDLEVTWLDPVLRETVNAGLFLSMTEQYLVPVDRVFLLQAAMAYGIPGAGQNIVLDGARLTITSPAGTTGVVLRNSTVAGAAGAPIELPFAGSVVIPPSWTVRANVTFNAAAVANGVRLHVCGVLMPVANIQRV